MKYVLSVVALVAFGGLPASSDEIEPGMTVAALNNSAGSVQDERADRDRNMALIKEGEFESPERVALIERNREDRERMVVIDR
jgi:hypothetical protein